MRALTLYQTYARRAFAALGATIALCVFLYAVLLMGAVAHAAAQTAAESEVHRLASTIGSLEAEYLAQTKALSPSRAADLGFVRPAAVSVVYAAALPGLTVR